MPKRQAFAVAQRIGKRRRYFGEKSSWWDENRSFVVAEAGLNWRGLFDAGARGSMAAMADDLPIMFGRPYGR
jgi:hypothetical protein